MKLENFSKTATGWIALRRALYGDKDAQALVLRCFRKHPKASRINEPMVLQCWQEQDDAVAEALGFDPQAEREARRAAYLRSIARNPDPRD